MEALDSMSVVIILIACSVGALAMFFTRGDQFEPSQPPPESAVLLTGGNRGIGRVTAEHLASKGYTVFVTVRTQAQVDAMEKEGKGLNPVILDVTNDAHIDGAIEHVRKILGDEKLNLVAIVNNAGINPEGDELIKAIKEGVTVPNKLAEPSVAERVFATNVIGLVRVTRAFLPSLTKGGRVIHIGSYFGSISGKVGLNHVYYEATKFALEGLTDGMRRSLMADDIHVCLVKPGNIKTDMNEVAGETAPEVVAKDVEHAVGSPQPRPRYYPGTVKGYPVRLLCWVFEHLSTWVTDKL